MRPLNAISGDGLRSISRADSCAAEQPPGISLHKKNVQTMQLAMRSWFLNPPGHDLQCNSYEKLQFGRNYKSHEQLFARARMQPPV